MSAQNKVALFLDFENLFFGMKNYYNELLDPRSLVEKAKEYGQISHAKAFANFESEELRRYMGTLRTASIEAIHVPEEKTGNRVKSYVDFTMLEDIFQTVHDRPDLLVYVLGTGDGHFSGVAAKLKFRLGRQVVIIGVKGTINRELALAAESVVELGGVARPAAPVDGARIIRLVAAGEAQGRIITLTSTVRVATVVTQGNELDVRKMLSEMASEGIFVFEVEQLPNGDEVRRMRLNREHPTVKEALAAPLETVGGEAQEKH